MGLKDVLQKMKLVESVDQSSTPEGTDTASAGRPGKPGAKSPVDMREILKSVPASSFDEKALPKPPSGDATMPDFDTIYRAAGITDPPHGFTALKVLELLSSEGFLGLDISAKANAVSSVLKMNPGGPVPIADVIQDAVRRDHALNDFEGFLRKKLEKHSQQVDKENEQLQREIDALARKNRDKMEANRKAIEDEQRSFTEWQAKKRAQERRLFDAVAPFVESNPVILSGPSGGSPSQKPGTPQR